MLASVPSTSRSVEVFFNDTPTVAALVKFYVVILKLVDSTAQVPVCVPE